MTDRELLELAAKAAGVYLHWPQDFGGADFLPPLNTDGWKAWRPLTDDGDALRLAVKLRLCYGPNLDGNMAVVFGDNGWNVTEPYEPDPCAATRRAIVRAAAEIGKVMP